jgi:putative acetyltransferase
MKWCGSTVLFWHFVPLTAVVGLNVVQGVSDAKRCLRMSQLTIAPESPNQPDVIALLEASDRYHAALYPSESNHLVSIESLMTPNSHFLVARGSDGWALGCGAILLSEDPGTMTAELKRMWVAPATRGSGLGRRLLEALEAAAIREGVTVLRLETGISQPEAIGLYRAAGFSERGPFGSYTADPLSIFMEKAV